jgi:hypothetical protein
MALVLSKTGITTSNTVEAWHVTQSVDALTGAAAYDISISGSLKVTGSIATTQGISGSFTGSFGGNLNGTALLATTASYALTSSYVLNAISASFASTASMAVSSSFATTASYFKTFPYTGSAIVSGSFVTYGLSQIDGINVGLRNGASTQLGNAALLSLTSGDENTAVGSYAGYNLEGGSDNTIVGAFALQQSTTGFGNTAMGSYALHFLTTGFGNTSLGYFAGYNNTTGSYNVYIGNEVPGVAGESNKLRIHSSVSSTTTPLILGDFSTRDLTINGDLIVSASQVLTLQPKHPLPTGVATGSFAVSASTPPRPYMWDGSSWYAL